MSGPLPSTPARLSPASITLLFGCAIASFVLPCKAGWGALPALEWTVFVAAFVLLPGCALRAWIDRERDVPAALFLSLILGLAGLSFAFLVLAVLDARGFVWIVPVAGAIAWFAARKRPMVGAREELTLREVVAMLVPLGAVLTRVIIETPSDWYIGYDTDAGFHVQNATELARHWPMTDPRIVGEPLRYHFLSYTPAAAASIVLGLPVRECMQGLGASFLPLVFALGLFAGARALGAKPIAAMLVSLALVLHADLGAFVGRLFHFDGSLGSYFDVGLYLSTTTAQGLCALIALVIVAADLLEARIRLRSGLVLIAVFAALASGSKGSVLPPLILALGVTWIFQAGQRGLIARTAIVVVCASLPFTLWLVLAPDGYAQSMFSWSPGAAQAMSAFQWKFVKLFGGDPRAPHALATAALFVPWCIGFLGLGALALWAWFATRARPARTIETLLLAAAVCGMIPAVLFAAPGLSQLFFAYDAQVCAVLLGAIASTRITTHKGRGFAFAAVALLLVQVAASWTSPGLRRIRVEFEGDTTRYRGALDWIRTETPNDAVFLIDDPRLSAATWIERRAFFETQRYSARVHAGFTVDGGAARENDLRPYGEHERAQTGFFAGPAPSDVGAIRALVGPRVPVYALRSNVAIGVRSVGYGCELRPLVDSAAFGRAAGLELVHDAGVAAVYRLPD